MPHHLGMTLDDAANRPALPALRLMLTFRALDRLVLPTFRGAMWRGVLGRALKRLSDAAAIDNSIWPGDISPVSFGGLDRAALYETLFAPEGDGAFARTPAPFVIDAPGSASNSIEAGQTEMIGLTLFGPSIAAMPAILACFAIAARDGLGKQRGRAVLVEAAVGWRGPKGYQPIWVDGVVSVPEPLVPTLPPVPDMVEVMLATPLRLTVNKQAVAAQEFHPGLLLEQAVRRISLLQRLYGPHPVDADFSALFAIAASARMAGPQLYNAGQQRWSASQEEIIPMDGIVGSFLLPMDGIEALWPWLWAAQWFHLGKGASMGMGAVRLRAVR